MFVAKFIGNHPMNIFEGRIADYKGKLNFVSETFRLALTDRQAKMMIEQKVKPTVYMGIRPEHGRFEQEFIDASPQTTISATLDFNEYVGSDSYYHLLSHGKQKLSVRANPGLRYKEGDKISVALDMKQALFFDRDTQELMKD